MPLSAAASRNWFYQWYAVAKIEAKLSGAASVPVWGSGTPRREFLHVDDLADAVLYLLQIYDEEPIVNVG